jgi:hypothetical protein
MPSWLQKVLSIPFFGTLCSVLFSGSPIGAAFSMQRMRTRRSSATWNAPRFCDLPSSPEMSSSLDNTIVFSRCVRQPVATLHLRFFDLYIGNRPQITARPPQIACARSHTLINEHSDGLGSANGAWVNGVPCSQERFSRLRRGDDSRAMAHQDFAGSNFAGHEHRLLAALAALRPRFPPGKETLCSQWRSQSPFLCQDTASQLRAVDFRFKAAYHPVLQKAAY